MMEKQLVLLNQLCNCIFRTETIFDTVEFVYRFSLEEGCSGTRTHAIRNGKNVLLHLSDSTTDEIEDICENLHSEMQAHTGGDWRKFILTIDENGKAKTKFIYEVQSCMDDFDDL